jgi:hypothetical protein
VDKIDQDKCLLLIDNLTSKKIKFKGGAKMHGTLQRITNKLQKLERKEITEDRRKHETINH